MKKTSKQTTDSKPNLHIRWESDEDYGGSIVVFTKPVGERPEDLSPWTYWPPENIVWCCEEITEPTCCGIPVLGEFYNIDNESESKGREKEIGELLAFKLEKVGKKRKKYFAAYLPNVKDFDVDRKVLAAAGFKPGVTMTSKHGKYTNTRWEWFSSSYKEPNFEKIVPTYPV